jgi:hypothetical protein
LPLIDTCPQWLGEHVFSHVYFFASPPILKHAGSWDPQLFSKFASAYVHAFATLIALVLKVSRAAPPTRFFYPSSVFVTRPETGFAEYTCAKAAGEALCAQFADSRALFFAPRLPRLRTDQTVGVEGAVEDPFPTLLQAIQTFHSQGKESD